jgi:gliding motility-associated-like protein
MLFAIRPSLKLLLPVLLLVAGYFPSSAQYCPPNVDFEEGSFNKWQCFIGAAVANGNTNSIILTPSNPSTSRHELISSATAKDFYGQFPQRCPYGGNYSVKLGNNSVAAEAEGISYTFQVPANIDTFSFTYFYAVVLENPEHDPHEQPRFFVTAYDVQTGALINCASYDYVSTGGLPGFKVSPVNSDVLYKEWSPATIQFAGMANKTVRLEFKTADCTRGGHFGYAYLDVGSNCSNMLATAPYCIETNSLILNAPFGFQSYVWYNEDFTQVIGNTQSVTLSPPPANNTTFNVDVIPYPGYGCRDTVITVATPFPVPGLPGAEDTARYCQYQAAQPLKATASAACDLLWYTTPSGGVGMADAPVPSTSAAGVFHYWVSQKVLFGCESFRKKITVVVLPTPTPSFTINDDAQCLAGNSFTFNSTSTDLSDSTYAWDFGDGNTGASTISAQHTYGTSGTFNVVLKVKNGAACTRSISRTVKVLPPPQARFSYPSLICQNATQVQLADQSSVPGNLDQIGKWWWSIDGNLSTEQTPPSFRPSRGGKMEVKLVVTSANGCRSDTNTVNIDVRYQPTALFRQTLPSCENALIRFENQSSLPSAASPEKVARWDWDVDGLLNSTSQHPSWNLAAGTHQVRLVAESDFGCRSEPLVSNITVYSKPQVLFHVNDSCVNRPINYTASDATATVTQWYWNFGNGLSAGTPFMSHTYTRPDSQPVTLIGETTNGCRDTLTRTFEIYGNYASAGHDTVASPGEPVQLDGGGLPGYTFRWTPSTGLNDPASGKPIATLDRDQQYELYSLSEEGCESRTRITIRRFDGPEVYVPSAFTPNNDGRNDLAQVFPVGMKEFRRFSIYNRWGVMVFTTKDHTKGWDGNFQGKPMGTGTFVYIVEAVDFRGRLMQRKGTITLIR